MLYPKIVYRRTPTPIVCALDLGKSQDPSAMVLLERVDRAGNWNGTFWSYDVESTLHVRALERFPLGTTYTSIVADVAAMLRLPAWSGRTELVVDATGVGSAVVEMIERARTNSRLTSVVITGGDRVTKNNGQANVPKKELVTAMAVMLQKRWLAIPRNLAFSEVLIQEMTNFRVRYTGTGGQQFEAWRERDHDDLVLAMALACWKATDMWPEFNDEMAAAPRGLPPGTLLDERYSSNPQLPMGVPWAF